MLCYYSEVIFEFAPLYTTMSDLSLVFYHVRALVLILRSVTRRLGFCENVAKLFATSLESIHYHLSKQSICILCYLTIRAFSFRFEISKNPFFLRQYENFIRNIYRISINKSYCTFFLGNPTV